MKNVAVIGAGAMGNGIAHTFAQFDYKVQLIDISAHVLRCQSIVLCNQIEQKYAQFHFP